MEYGVLGIKMGYTLAIYFKEYWLYLFGWVLEVTRWMHGIVGQGNVANQLLYCV